jgi:hypothetical protein
MALNLRKFLEGLRIIPKASTSIDSAGEMEVLSSDNKLQYHNGASKSAVVTEAHSATLTNKTLTSPVLNTPTADTITGIAGGALTVQSASNQNLSLQAQGTGTVSLESLTIDANTITGGASTLTIQSALNQDIVLSGQGVGTVKVEGVVFNANQIIADVSVPLILTTQGNQNVTLTAAGTGVVNTTRPLKVSNLLVEDSAADTTSGSAVTLATPATSVVRLTNASLSSVNMIPAGVDGQQLALLNTTGAAVTFNDETGATAANRIRTGTGAPVTIQTNASIQLVYNGTTSRWMIVGGVGGGSSTVNATAGETLAIGDAVYVSVGATDGGRTAGRVYKLDATNNNRVEFIGFAADAATVGNSLRVQVAGELGGFSSLSTGQQMFASVTVPGGLQSTVPVVNGQWIIPLGIAKDSTNLVINSAGSATAVLISGAGSGTYFNVASTSANITLTDTNDIVLASAASGAITVTLPSPTSGKQLTVKKTDSTVNSVTVSPSGGQTIDGGASYSLNTQYQSISLVTDGSNWYLV